MQVKVIQTADRFKYLRMLAATSRTAKLFCERNGFGYEAYIGVKRGVLPVNAAFNRIVMLQEMLDWGYRGWVLYMDADAYIHDLDFDLRSYLRSRSDRAACIATVEGDPIPWHINSGVFLINFDHPQGRLLVSEWFRLFSEMTDERLSQKESVWEQDNDQTLLYLILRDNIAVRNAVFFEESRFLNHVESSFIRQYLNSIESHLPSRIASIEQRVAAVLEGAAA